MFIKLEILLQNRSLIFGIILIKKKLYGGICERYYKPS